MSNQTISYFTDIIRTSSKVDKKEKDILCLRLKGKTLEIIGKKLKVTGERIRQIEKNAIDKFARHVSQMVLFKD